MNFVLVGKRAAQLETIKKYITDITGYTKVSVTEKPSELVKDNNTVIIFVDVAFAYCWDWWMSADISNEFNRRKFNDEIMEFRQLDTKIYDYIVKYDGTEITSLNEKVCNYITSIVKGGGE